MISKSMLVMEHDNAVRVARTCLSSTAVEPKSLFLCYTPLVRPWSDGCQKVTAAEKHKWENNQGSDTVLVRIRISDLVRTGASSSGPETPSSRVPAATER